MSVTPKTICAGRSCAGLRSAGSTDTHRKYLERMAFHPVPGTDVVDLTL